MDFNSSSSVRRVSLWLGHMASATESIAAIGRPSTQVSSCRCGFVLLWLAISIVAAAMCRLAMLLARQMRLSFWSVTIAGLYGALARHSRRCCTAWATSIITLRSTFFVLAAVLLALKWVFAPRKTRLYVVDRAFEIVR